MVPIVLIIRFYFSSLILFNQNREPQKKNNIKQQQKNIKIHKICISLVLTMYFNEAQRRRNKKPTSNNTI